MRISILPIGNVDADALHFAQRGLGEVFPETEVVALDDTMVIPKEAYSSSRRQYHSTVILTKMSDYAEKADADLVLGVTEADLYVPNLNFVFGEARCPGREALISLFRLRPEFYGKHENKQLFHERALKEAVHELGHALGLEHCPNPSCIMFFSNSIMDTDRKQAEFCSDCHVLVHRALER